MAGKNYQSPTVAFCTLGCAKNTVDTERMLAEITQAGFLLTTDLDDADVVVINTCGFIAPARDEALQAIEQAIAHKRQGCVKKVIVTGCLSQRLGEQLFEMTNGIDAIVGLGYRDKIAHIIEKTVHSDTPAAYLDQPPRTICDDRVRLLITPRHWAYLRISEGCDHKCSFCTIPAIRGRFRSKPLKLVLAEAAELANAGVVELNVIAQDTTYYGRDLKMKNGLATLLTDLENISGPEWIRLMYMYPTGITDQLIETIAKSQKIVRYFDIPIQHVNNEILKDMRRPDTKERICRTIQNLRSAMSDCLLRTTVIVGWPGETERQFDELLEFIQWAQFDALGCFKFYPEAGTAAAKMPNQVPDQVKQQRLERLMLTQQKIAFAKNESRIGGKLTCLVDSVDGKRSARARFYGQAPDIDSVSIVKGCSAQPGQFIDAEVIATKDYDLVVKQIKY